MVLISPIILLRILPLFKESNDIWRREQVMKDFKFSRRRVWCSELSSGMYCRVKWLSTDVSEVRTASIIIPDDGGSTFETNVTMSKQVWRECKF
jgi:hypothetical protein